MSIIKIIKENDLGIPINTMLHSYSFFDRVSNDCLHWDSVSCYCWRDEEGELHIIKESKLYPKYKEHYINVIVLSNLKFAYEGETYWKVFTSKDEAQYHKIEYKNGKHIGATILKPYEDIVYNNTNSMYMTNIHRFKTEAEAINYINNTNFK